MRPVSPALPARPNRRYTCRHERHLFRYRVLCRGLRDVDRLRRRRRSAGKR